MSVKKIPNISQISLSTQFEPIKIDVKEKVKIDGKEEIK